MMVTLIFAQLLYALTIPVSASLESELDTQPELKFGELPVLEDQDSFLKTGSINVDANNYGKVLVNLCRSHAQI